MTEKEREQRDVAYHAAVKLSTSLNSGADMEEVFADWGRLCRAIYGVVRNEARQTPKETGSEDG